MRLMKYHRRGMVVSFAKKKKRSAIVEHKNLSFNNAFHNRAGTKKERAKQGKHTIQTKAAARKYNIAPARPTIPNRIMQGQAGSYPQLCMTVGCEPHRSGDKAWVVVVKYKMSAYGTIALAA